MAVRPEVTTLKLPINVVITALECFPSFSLSALVKLGLIYILKRGITDVKLPQSEKRKFTLVIPPALRKEVRAKEPYWTLSDLATFGLLMLIDNEEKKVIPNAKRKEDNQYR